MIPFAIRSERTKKFMATIMRKFLRLASWVISWVLIATVFWPFLTWLTFIPHGNLMRTTLADALSSGYMNLTIIFATLGGLILAAAAITKRGNVPASGQAVKDLFISFFLCLAGIFSSISLGLYSTFSTKPIFLFIPCTTFLLHTLYIGFFVTLAIFTALLFIFVIAFMYSGSGYLLVTKTTGFFIKPVRRVFKPFASWFVDVVMKRIRDLFERA
jgi:hypothetical protein